MNAKQQAAERVVGFLNTRPYAGLPERLGNAEAERLRGVLLSTITDGGSWDQVDDLLTEVAFRPRFSEAGRSWTQTAGDRLIGAVTHDVALLVETGSWSRVRLCAREECAGAFFDTSRSGTRRWHSYDTCGNRANVQASRARARRATSDTDQPNGSWKK